MGFNQILKRTSGGKGDVRVALRVGSRGKAGLIIILKDSAMQKIGEPDAANAWLGDDDDEGKILIQFDAAGSIPIRRLHQGGAGLRIAPPAFLDAKSRKAMVCQHEFMEGENGEKQLCIVLPPSWLS